MAVRRPRGMRVEPLIDSQWEAFERLFGERGACGGCWCMTPRLSSREYEANKGAGNRRMMRRLVKKGPPPGVIGFHGDEPVAWCAISPRSEYGRIARSPILRPIDDLEVWSIACLFIERHHRRQGWSTAMIEAAVQFARGQGATCIEGYPVIPKKNPMPDVFAYTGLAPAFLAAGFREVARRSETRPIMRRRVRAS